MVISYLVIEVIGLNLDEFLKKVISQNISLFEIQKTNAKNVTFKISSDDYKKLKKLRIYKFYKVRIKRVRGLKELLQKALTGLGVFLGISLSFLCYFISSTVLSDVVLLKDNNHQCRNKEQCIYSIGQKELLFDYLSEIGVVKGAKLKSINPTEIEREIIKRFSNVSSCSVRKNGVVLEISIHEAVLKNDNIVSSFDIIAPENGKIISTNIIDGNLLVKAGDIVKKGQVLVSGADGRKAMGEIKIALYFHSGLMHNEKSIGLEETGNTITFEYYSINGKPLFKQNNVIPYTYFNKTTKSVLISPNLLVPVYLVTETFTEQVETTVITTFESVRRKLEEELLSSVRTKMGDFEPNTLECVYIPTKLADGVYLLDCYSEVITILNNK